MDYLLARSKKLFCGITIVEVMIVVVIIAFLALIVFWANKTQVYKGYDSRRKADIAEIKIAIEQYEKDHDCYPLSDVVSCKPGTGLQPYLEKIPCDPRNGSTYYYEYEKTLCPKWYWLYANLENKTDKQATPGIGPNGAFNYSSGSPNAPSSGQTPSPSQFFGCKSGSCVPIAWDPTRPGPACDPNSGSSDCDRPCRDDLGLPIHQDATRHSLVVVQC